MIQLHDQLQNAQKDLGKLEKWKDGNVLEADTHTVDAQHSNIPSFQHSGSYFFSEVFNIAYGGNTTLNQLFSALRDNLAEFDDRIKEIEPEYGPFRVGDIPHSQASVLKAKTILDYDPKYDAKKGFELAAEWYYRKS